MTKHTLKRRDLLKLAAFSPAALFVTKMPSLTEAPLSNVRLAREGAKRLHAEIIHRGAKIDPNKPVEFFRKQYKGDRLVKVETQTHPYCSTYACDDSSIFNLDAAIQHLADKLVGRIAAPLTTLRFFPQSVDQDILRPEFFAQGWCGDVYLTASRYIAANTKREVTMLEVWAG